MFENNKCEYCGEQFAKNDDIVVCPDCGAPYHRACWQEHGECAHKQEHAQGYHYTKSNADTAQEVTADEEDFVEKIKKQILSEQPQTAPKKQYCERCGAKLLEGDDYCIYCSHKQGDPIKKHSQKHRGKDPLGGLSPTDTIGGETVNDVALVVKSNADKLLPRLKKTDEKKFKIGWSWSAFFFGYLYFFFRKLYKYGMIIILLNVMLFNVLNVALGDPIGKTMKVTAQVYEQYAEYSSLMRAYLDGDEEAFASAQSAYDEAQALMNKEMIKSGVLAKCYIVAFSSLLVSGLLCALLFHYLYLRHCTQTIARMRRSAEILGDMSRADFRLNLMVRGGVSVFGIVLGYMSNFFIEQAVAYLIEMSTKMFGG